MRDLSIRKLVISCIAIGATLIAMVGHLVMGLTFLGEPYGVELGIIVTSYAQVGVATIFLVLNIVAFFVFKQIVCKRLGVATLSVLLAVTVASLTFSAIAMYTVPADISDYFVTLCIKWAVIFVSIAGCFIAYFVCSWYVTDRYIGAHDDIENFVEDEDVELYQDEEKAPEIETTVVETLTPFSEIHIDVCAMMFRKDVPTEKLLYLREALSHADDSKYAQIFATPTKDPTTVLLFSIFFGSLGVDRFYIGDIGLGVAKLFLNAFTLGLWWILDIYFCRKKAKEKNLTKILDSINE